MKVEKKTVLNISIAVFLLYLCFYYWSKIEKLLLSVVGVFLPIIIGFSVAYILNILMTFYEKHYFTKKATLKIIKKSRRPVCMIAAIFSLIAVVMFVVGTVLPELITCLRLLASEIPTVIERVLNNEYVAKIVPENIIEKLSYIDWQKYIENIASAVGSGIGNAASAVFNVITTFFSAVVTFFLSSVFAIYFLSGKEKLTKHINLLSQTYLPEKIRKKLVYIIKTANESFRRYIVGQCTEAVILGVLCMAGMFLLRLPYAVMIGTLIGLTALIPIAGAYIGAAIGSIMIFAVSPLKSLIFLIFIIVLQQIEGNLIYPRVVGRTLGLPAVLVLFAITIGGGIGGIFGMLIGVPIASVIYTIIRDDIYKKEGEKKIEAKENNKQC